MIEYPSEIPRLTESDIIKLYKWIKERSLEVFAIYMKEESDYINKIRKIEPNLALGIEEWIDFDAENYEFDGLRDDLLCFSTQKFVGCRCHGEYEIKKRAITLEHLFLENGQIKKLVLKKIKEITNDVRKEEAQKLRFDKKSEFNKKQRRRADWNKLKKEFGNI